ncbi:conjugal transfer protein [Marinilactibacillus psychrotolerans]|uniref:conjugal transfer protein n=1 Tax=Marinilactibacillus psychrotolerans TaxID=191770 RepID=UPI001C7D0716|nr:conjugal transfer protein [Marinilactibacillus psychrotolerans]GEQ33600.1 conjugal transfer protein [Marinilactibacillus psychrotolerans]
MSRERSREAKKFVFPENVSSEYGAVLGLTLKEVLIYVLPLLVLSVIFLAIPPYTVFWVFGKVLTILFVVTTVIAIITSSPVKSRGNVKLLKHLKMKQKYGKRQRLYYKAKKENRF